MKPKHLDPVTLLRLRPIDRMVLTDLIVDMELTPEQVVAEALHQLIIKRSKDKAKEIRKVVKRIKPNVSYLSLVK